MVLYLGTDAQLETTEFSPDAPAFYIGTPSAHWVTPGIASETEAAVREHFSTPHVYYLGSHMNCGCGFGYGLDPEWYEWAAEFPDQVDLDPQEAISRRQLVELLQSLVEAKHNVEVFVSEGSFLNEPPDYRNQVSPEAFLDPASVLNGHLLAVTGEPLPH
ncbi:MAG: hypothetical protein AAF170_18855 [Bacteroidota bacterium]